MKSEPKVICCPACGRGNGDWAHLCGHCGASLIAMSVMTPNDCPKCIGLGYCRCEIASNE